MKERQVLFAVFLMFSTIFPASWLRAETMDRDDDSLGITRAINIDEASVETALYLIPSIDNDFSQGHIINLQDESVFALTGHWGLEVDFPQVLIQQPLGQGSAALGPIGLGFRYRGYQFGTENSETAGVFSAEAFGAYWATPNSQFQDIGSTLTFELLEGFRWGKAFLQGNYGYNTALDSNTQNSWFANSALGYPLSDKWVVQMEADFTANPAVQWTFVPQIGFKTGHWLFEVGEALNASGPGTATDLIVELDI